MASEPSRKIGSMVCLVCGEVMPVRQNGRDTLNLSCPWCGYSSYAKGGTQAHRIVSEWIRKDAAVPEKEISPVASTVAAAPVPVASASVAKIAKAVRPAFDMGVL